MGMARMCYGECRPQSTKMPVILANYRHRSLLLDSLNVLSLPALGAFGDVELYGLAFLQAAETARLNRREVHEYVFATLTADETIALRVVKPLYCSCF
jgi:hypothetical protein